MLSSQLSPRDLVTLCRAMRHQLAAGVAILRVLGQQAERGPRAVRPVAARLFAALSAGESISAALDRESASLPPLFIALAKLGEETGHFPEILGALERYYEMQASLRRQFISRAFAPLVQFVLGVVVVAGLIFVLGLLSGANSPLKFFGVSGAPGSLAFLATVGGTIALFVLAWVAFRRWSRQRATSDRVLLRIPALGPCIEALALSRFTLALQLTLDSSLSIMKAVRLSLRATGIAAYAELADGVAKKLKAGHPLCEALADTGRFPYDFVQVVASAEEVGSVPEVMRQQAEHYHEEAGRRMTALTRAANALIWLMYAGFMIWMIFRIFTASYGPLLGL